MSTDDLLKKLQCGAFLVGEGEIIMLGRQSTKWRNLSLVVFGSAMSGMALALAFDLLLAAVALIGMQATGFPMTALVSLILSGQVANLG